MSPRSWPWAWWRARAVGDLHAEAEQRRRGRTGSGDRSSSSGSGRSDGMKPNTTWSPGASQLTPARPPRTTPAPSWPPMIGRANGRSPVTRCSSEWHMPDAASLTSTSPGLGGSSSISSTLQSLPTSHRIAALVFMANPRCMWLLRRRIAHASDAARSPGHATPGCTTVTDDAVTNPGRSSSKRSCWSRRSRSTACAASTEPPVAVDPRRAATTLDPQVALRPEPFGALAYHYGNRRLIFLQVARPASRVVRGARRPRHRRRRARAPAASTSGAGRRS